ncbi:MAG: hypothetical protein PUJ24_07155, partial [Bacteroidales bacterium]|nr:hypothetical protein [Bacteroidales bacterium]
MNSSSRLPLLPDVNQRDLSRGEAELVPAPLLPLQMKQRHINDVKAQKADSRHSSRPRSFRHYMLVNDMKLSLSSLRHGAISALLALFVSSSALANPDAAPSLPPAAADAPALAQLPPAVNGWQVEIALDDTDKRILYFRILKDGKVVTPDVQGAQFSLTINGAEANKPNTGNASPSIETKGTYAGWMVTQTLNCIRSNYDYIKNGASITFSDLDNILSTISEPTISTSINESILGTCPTEAQLSSISITENGSYGCADDVNTYIQTSSSHAGVIYTVWKCDDAGNPDQPYSFSLSAGGSKVYSVEGNPGNQALRFFISEAGKYKIKAECSSDTKDVSAFLSGIFEVRDYNPLTTIGTNNYCQNDLTGRILYIQNSEYNVKYSLYRNGSLYSTADAYNPVGKADNGTDEISLNGLPNGVYTVYAQRIGCSTNALVNGQLVISPEVERTLTSTTIAGSGSGCVSNNYKIGLSAYSAGVTYSLVRTDAQNNRTVIETFTPVNNGTGYQFSTTASDPGTYTIATSNPTCETVAGELIIDRSATAQVSLSYKNDKCDYTFYINGSTNPDYTYYLYVETEGKDKPRASVRGNGGDVAFPTAHRTQSSTEVFKAYARPKDATDNSCEEDVIGSVTVPGVPKSPQPTKTTFYYCGTNGGDVVVTLGDNVTAICKLYKTNGTLVQEQSIKTSDTEITFNNILAGDYYVIAENLDGCQSDKSSQISVKGREFDPTLSPEIPAVFCMSENGKTEYKVTIVYADAPKNNAAAYDFKVHIVPTVGKEYVIPSTDATVKQNNSYTYTFTFVADDYELTQGEVDIYIETTPGQTDLICESEHYKFKIQPQPEKPVVSVSYGQASAVACEGDEASLTATSAAASADGDTWYYVYADFEPTPSSSPNYIIKSKNDAYNFTVKIPDGAPIGKGHYDTDGNYHRFYYVVARDADQSGCSSDATVYEMVIRPDNTRLNIDQKDPRWSICEDSDPVTLLSYFYPGDGTFYIVGTDQDKLLPITKKINGSTVFDPRIFTPSGIDYVKGGYDVNQNTDPTRSDYVPAGFQPFMTSKDANSVTYTIRYKQPWCPNTFYIDGKLTVNKKRDIGEYGIKADDCYCTNDLITVEGYPNTILNEYGYAKLLCEGILEKDQPEDDGNDWRYTFSPVLRYRGNSNGKTIEFTFEYKDGATGCIYQVKKESKLYQPVADEIYFTIGGVPDGENFQGGFSEDYFCPEDDSEHKLIPYVYQYQFYDDGSPKLSYGSATNNSSLVTFTPSVTLSPSEKVAMTDLGNGYHTVGKWSEAFSVISEGGYVKFQPVWSNSIVSLKLQGNTPDGLTVRVVAELSIVDKSTTGTPLLEATVKYEVTTLSYYTFTDGKLVSSNAVDKAVLAKYDAYEYKKPFPLTDYTNQSLGNYYYKFTGGPHIKVKLDDKSVHA